MQRTVIFDFGAVLFRWQPVQLFIDTLPEYAADAQAASALAAQVFQSFTPASDWSRFDLGLMDEATLAVRIAQRTGLPTQAVSRLIHAVPAHLQAQPDTVAVFHALKAAGHRLVYLSNMPRSYASHLERHNPFIAEFDDGIFSGRVGLMKPWPAMYELAHHRFGLSSGTQALFIDDHAGNVEAGQRQGWDAIQFTHAPALREALVQKGWLV
jgi:putative hydrolase of the HAD superfamily